MRDEGPQPGRELLAAYRDERGPSPAAAARLLAALEREIADDLSHGAGPSGQVSRPPGSGARLTGRKLRPTRSSSTSAGTLSPEASVNTTIFVSPVRIVGTSPGGLPR